MLVLHKCKYLIHIKIAITFNNGREIIKVERQAYTTLAFMAFCWQTLVKNASCELAVHGSPFLTVYADADFIPSVP